MTRTVRTHFPSLFSTLIAKIHANSVVNEPNSDHVHLLYLRTETFMKMPFHSRILKPLFLQNFKKDTVPVIFVEDLPFQKSVM